jgi:1-phosphofructokinase family hexose kinase
MILTVTLNPCLERSQFLSSPRAGAVNRAARVATVPGGKGVNAARMAHTLGEQAVPLLPLGGETGALMARVMRENDGLEPAVVQTQAPTRLQFNLIDEAAQSCTSYLEPGAPLIGSEIEGLLAGYHELLPQSEFVILSGSSPCELADDVYHQMAALARPRGVRVLLDTYGRSLALGLEARPDLLKVNVPESEGLLGRRIESEADRWQALEFYRARGVETGILTLGAEGALALEGDERWIARPPEVRALNPVGCGDALAAGIAVGLLRGLSFPEALRLGTAAGAASAATWFPASARREEVEGLLEGVGVRALKCGGG